MYGSIKQMMGMATYGRTFTLINAAQHGIGAPADIGWKGGKEGPYTGIAGMLGYNEICEFLSAGWTAYRDDTQKVVYAVSDKQWVGYDDEMSLKDKLSYLKGKGLGGAIVWSIDTDDFHGYCGGRKHPLIKTISQELNETNGTPYNVVCYWGSWSWYRDGGGGKGKFAPEMSNPLLCTHMMYGFAKLGAGGEIEVMENDLDLGDTDYKSGLPWGEGMYRRIEHLRDVNHNMKAMISIGGWNEGSDKYSQMASSPDSRKKFVNSVVKFIQTYKFDGLDVDWEYPGFKAVGEADRVPGNPKDKENYISLLRELRAALKPHNYLLSAAVSAGKKTIDISYDVKQLNELLDFINVMAYDFHGGAWENKTGHNAPLYPDPKASEEDKELTVSYGVEYWIKQGANPKKLMMGMGTYGRSFTLANAAQHGIGAACASGSKGGNAGPYTNEVGILGYNEVYPQCLYNCLMNYK
ncbi:unnamed protein product [Oppiella nova]|uniref:GH18 domain-containing protein n=1 Tax=Oppiella nova TaxID=334625 RepID=A0A7R9QTC0_9ACAR|nr:unnamed protein product [Oppiella nova]CAG2174944.1 unnamed protein product [Oppiella nova]